MFRGTRRACLEALAARRACLGARRACLEARRACLEALAARRDCSEARRACLDARRMLTTTRARDERGLGKARARRPACVVKVHCPEVHCPESALSRA